MICASPRSRVRALNDVFTGIVQHVGEIAAYQLRGIDAHVSVRAPGMNLGRYQIGDSMAVAGICLTIVALTDAIFECDVSAETLRLTTAGTWQAGTRVNLEPALRLGDVLGGHIVSGHIDGLAELVGATAEGRSRRLEWRAPAPLAKFIAAKGSVALDGVSLTVNDVTADRFGVNLIPHTLDVTTFGQLQVGQSANLEVDLMARYAERLLAAR
jgi:riboflavin synthase